MNKSIKLFMIYVLSIFLFASSPVTYEATAYTKNCKGCSGITSTGIKANPYGKVKMMAVDPKHLKLGKCYILQFKDGHRSIYLAADTGLHIKGKRIDLLLKTHESAVKFGRQKVSVIGLTKCPK